MHIALCIPTYENSKVVEDFLINCAPYYMECGIDIYFYDSSREDATIILQFQNTWNQMKRHL